MPRAIPPQIRRAIIERHLAGQALATIARGLDLSWSPVRDDSCLFSP
jgi:hypothetical protein